MAAQERGAIALGEAVQGLGVNTRVLMIGAHPDDEDTNLIAWLSRGRHVTTAYLSLTRGDGGQNIIGNELGEALGVLRTEELLAARRIDGALQYFTRAYDFGYSKDTADTFDHWPKDTILGDVVRVVRAFRPHVIVAVFSGTSRDGHGQHQAAGILAREAYDLSGDSARFSVSGFGQPWVTPKFYRAARGNAQAGTLGMNVGEYSPLRGESYGEIAGRSRSQHKSQAFGALERKEPIMNYVRREATRVNESTPPTSERSLFDGIDTTWARVAAATSDPRLRALVDSLPAAFGAARVAYDAMHPERLIGPLLRVHALLDTICTRAPCSQFAGTGGNFRRVEPLPDLTSSVLEARLRAERALQLAHGVVIEATSVEEWPVNGVERVLVSIYNQGVDTVLVGDGVVTSGHGALVHLTERRLPPGGVLQDTLLGIREFVPTQPSWLMSLQRSERAGSPEGWFRVMPRPFAENRPVNDLRVMYPISLAGHMKSPITIMEPIVYRYADDVRGEIRRPVAVVPRVTLTFAEPDQVARANAAVDRLVELRVHLAGSEPRDVRVTLSGRGLEGDGDSVTHHLRLAPTNRDTTIPVRIRSALRRGVLRVRAVANSGEDWFHHGYRLVDYDHIEPRRIYRPAQLSIAAVDVRVPERLRVAYVPGVADNIAPILSQLGVPVTVIPAAEIGRADLSAYTTVVIGPRAYDANPELVNANPRLFDFARNGGTLVVQYGQYEMTRPGYTPYPLTIRRPHSRVTHEDAPITLLDTSAAVLRAPNRITTADFAGWVQERGLYMPISFDDQYRPVLAMADPGEELNRGAILVAPLGQGTYVYTSLAFFRQLPAGVQGAARLFVNLLSAGQTGETR